MKRIRLIFGLVSILWIALLLLLPGLSRAEASGATVPLTASRTLYILHGGMSDPINESTTHIHDFLLKQGIADDDIVVLPDPYPFIPPQNVKLPPKKELWGFLKREAVEVGEKTLENMEIYKNSADPESEISKTTYQTMLDALKAKQQETPGTPVRLVWIGLSAGGQMGLTMADKLATEKPGFALDTVVTLGSPIVNNHAPASVRIVSCISDQDEILRQTTRPGYAEILIGSAVTRLPPNMDGNDEVREIPMTLRRKYDPTEGHNLWHEDSAILARALNGIVPERV